MTPHESGFYCLTIKKWDRITFNYNSQVICSWATLIKMSEIINAWDGNRTRTEQNSEGF